jgi:hypothetical protein
MKEAMKSYFTFHRSQRLGIIIFMSLLLILLAGLTIMHYGSRPEPTSTNIYPAPVAEDSTSNEE